MPSELEIQQRIEFNDTQIDIIINNIIAHTFEYYEFDKLFNCILGIECPMIIYIYTDEKRDRVLSLLEDLKNYFIIESLKFSYKKTYLITPNKKSEQILKKIVMNLSLTDILKLRIYLDSLNESDYVREFKKLKTFIGKLKLTPTSIQNKPLYYLNHNYL